MVGEPRHLILWSRYDFGAWRHRVSVNVTNLSPRGLEGALIRPKVSSLGLDVSRRSPFIKS